ncbi:MAG TPA: PRC-barrel domain-containing protein [Xanthobacteraceae bacterium]|nr:PRC-barrel domain-containing protein [Xanthobacteraceae bacterium]
MRTSSEPSAPQSVAQGVAGAGKTGVPPSLGVKDAEPVLGKSVHSSTGEDMGRLVDVIVDTDGRPRAAIIDFGGFLGVGSRKIAVDWSVLKFVPGDPKGNVITVALTKDQVKAAPEFKEGSPVVPLGASGSPPPQAAAPPPSAAVAPPAPAAQPRAPAASPAAPAPPSGPAAPPQAPKK